MHRQGATSLTAVSFFLDFILAGFSFFLAYNLKIGLPGDLASLSPISEYGWLFFTYLGLLLLANYLQGFYYFGRTMTNGEIITNVTRSNVITMLVLMMIFFDFKVHTISRLLFVMFAIVNILLVSLFKLLLKWVTGRFQKQGFNVINALLIGTGDQAEFLIESIRAHPELGYRVVGCLSKDEEKVGEVFHDIEILGTTDQLKDILLKYQIDEVFFAMPLGQAPDLPEMIWTSEEIGIRFSLMADFIRTSIAKSSVQYFLDVPLVTFSTTPSAVWQLFIKAIFDRVVAAAGLVIFSPVFLIGAIFIKLTSPGPVFFTQTRCGLNGRLFKMFKFRTMVEHAEQLKEELRRYNEMEGPVFKIKEDPRVTNVGRLLRRFSLDELPQLFNVFKGEMSLVGPRPPIPEEVEKYQSWQRRRLSMRPGLTCFWQISGRNEIDFDQWMKMDLKYIDNWSLSLDFIILGKTIPVILTGHGAS